MFWGLFPAIRSSYGVNSSCAAWRLTSQFLNFSLYLSAPGPVHSHSGPGSRLSYRTVSNQNASYANLAVYQMTDPGLPDATMDEPQESFEQKVLRKLDDLEGIKTTLTVIEQKVAVIEQKIEYYEDKKRERIRGMTREGVQKQLEVAYKYLKDLYAGIDIAGEDILMKGVKMNIIIVGIASLLDSAAYADYVFSEKLALKDKIYFQSYGYFQIKGLVDARAKLLKLKKHGIAFFDAVNDTKHCTLGLDAGLAGDEYWGSSALAKELIDAALPLVGNVAECFSNVS